MSQLKAAQNELESMKSTIEEENEAKAELMRHMSKANAEVQQLKSRLETESGLLVMHVLTD